MSPTTEVWCFCDYRETFLVPQDMILVPKVYTTLPICMLHVVNNDTMEQVPKVFQKVVPYLYPKNKVGAECIPCFLTAVNGSSEASEVGELVAYLGGRVHYFNDRKCCSTLDIPERTHCTRPLLKSKPHRF